MDENDKSEPKEDHTDFPSIARAMQTTIGANCLEEAPERHAAASGVFTAFLSQANLSVGEAFQAGPPLAASSQAPSSDMYQMNAHHQSAQDSMGFLGSHTTLQTDRLARTDAQLPFQDNSFRWGAGGKPSMPFQSANSTYEQGGFEPLGTGGPLSSAPPPVYMLHHMTRHVPEPSAQSVSMMPGASGYAAGSVAAPNPIQVSESLFSTSVARMPSETKTTTNKVKADHFVTVVQPQNWDILYGRGKQHRKHPGNKRMKLLIDLHRDAYSNADRIAKTNMSKDIVKIIKSSGDKSSRFLRFDKKVNGWVEVSDESAREKISHAMRDGKTRPLERLDPKVFDEMPLLSDHIKQNALRKLVESKGSRGSSSPAADHSTLLDESMQGQANSKQEGTYQKNSLGDEDSNRDRQRDGKR